MDARNHGDSPHTTEMNYDLMAGDLARLVNTLNLTTVNLAGHSMGGHGALVAHLKNPGMYTSISAFAPICNPTAVPWGEKVRVKWE